MRSKKTSMTAEERAKALADMFGKHCSIDEHKDKRARKDLDADSIEFLVRQMRLEIDLIPPNQKAALMEAQVKCSRTEEFSDKRLERFLRCEGMNTKVRLFYCCMLVLVANHRASDATDCVSNAAAPYTWYPCYTQ